MCCPEEPSSSHFLPLSLTPMDCAPPYDLPLPGRFINCKGHLVLKERRRKKKKTKSVDDGSRCNSYNRKALESTAKSFISFPGV